MNTECFVISSGSVSQRVDLQDNVPLFVTYNILDIREPQTQISNWSKTLRFPGTKNNNILFQHIFEIGIDGGFNPNKKADVYFLQDTIETLRGVLQLKKISRSGNLDLIYYECNAFGGNDSLFTRMGEGKLSDLDFSEYDHEYNITNQEDSWTASVGSGYVYPMIDYKGANPDSGLWYVEDFFPAVFVKEIWDKIFEASGKTYTSTFLNSNRFKRLVIPYSGATYQFTDVEIREREFKASLSTNFDTALPNSVSIATAVIPFDDELDPNYDPSGIYDTSTYEWTVPAGQGGIYRIQSNADLSFRFHVSSGSFTLNNGIGVACWLVLKINGVVKQTTAGLANITSPGAYPYVFANDSIVTADNPATRVARIDLDKVHLLPGDIVTLEVRASFAAYNPTDFSGTGATVYFRVGADGYFKNQFYNEITEGAQLSMNRVIPPDVAMKDFVLSIIDMFRLYMQTDPDNPDNYLLEPRDDWYNSEVVDWSNKLDYERGLTITPMAELQGKRYIYRYKDDKDYYNDTYQKSHLLDGKAKTYGQRVVVVDNDFVTNDVLTQPIFSPTPMSDDAVTHDRIIPRIFDYDTKAGIPKTITANVRILYWAGLIDYTGVSWRHVDRSGTSNLKTQYPYAGHLDNPFEPTFDLSFGVPEEVYWSIKRQQYTDNNLFNSYHSRALREIIDPNARLVSGYFWLRPSDIFLLSFRKLYYFEKDLYRLNKIIDYDLSTEKLVECEFIKVFDPGAYVSTQRFVIGGPTTIGGGGDITPRPPDPPPTHFDNLHNTQEHVVVGTGNVVSGAANGVVIVGDNNTVGPNANNIQITGSENIIYAGVENVTLINSSNLSITDSDVLYINNCRVDSCPVDQSDIDTSFSARSGVATLADSTVHVVNPLVTSASVIVITAIDSFVGMLTVTAGVGSFDINSSIVGEAGEVNYFIAKY
jgi:hypothetical protein